MQSQDRYEAILQEARRMIDDGESVEASLRYMRSAGLSQIECVKAVKALMGGNLGEAKEIVHFSETWSDTRQDQEQLHRNLRDGLSGES